MSMTYKGKPFNANTFAKDLEADYLSAIKEQLHEQISTIRHPDTGEFPTVQVLGETPDDLRLVVEGSPELLDVVKGRVNPEDMERVQFMPTEEIRTPKAFLSYSFEDSEIARRVANALMAQGVDVWWAEWEIRAGDSLRQRIDDGLGNCTHFLVLLTPGSLQKPWVNQEMDAGLVRRISGQARFVALRHGLSFRELPPLLSGMLSPEISDEKFDESIRNLVNDIHGLNRKPELGPAPSPANQPHTGYSKAATAIAEIFVKETETALFGDPQKGTDKLAEIIQLSVEDVEDALHELRDMVTVSHDRVLPQTTLFTAFDAHFMPWSPEQDALRLAADILGDSAMPHNTEEIASRYGWEPRRMNPAVCYLLSRKLIVDYQLIGGAPWYTFRVVANDSLRRFVRSRS
jgi:hypothetical protein